jgi:hypothetical protein
MAAAVVSPTMAAAAPVGAAPAPAVAAAVAAPAPTPGDSFTSSAEGDSSVHDQWYRTKGTAVTVRNTGDQSIWLRKYDVLRLKWESPEEIPVGGENRYCEISANLDDVELLVFFDKGKADRNDGGVNVDAENPAYSSPWMSVDWNSEYFSIGGTYTWVAKDGSRFWGKRGADSDRHKEFELHVTNT